jgi:hypothetical protein
VIYIIKIKGRSYVKIGYSIDPQKRLKELQTGNHQKLELLKVFDGSRELEYEFHTLFAGNRVQGEWFNYNRGPSLLKFCVLALLQNDKYEITCIRTFQQAGLQAQIKNKAKRNKKVKKRLTSMVDR